MGFGPAFIHTRSAVLAPRQGPAHRSVRNAALTPRQGPAHRHVRGAPAPLAFYSPGSGGHVLAAPANAYGGVTLGQTIFAPFSGFGGVTGGEVVFIGVTRAVRLTAVGVAPFVIELAWVDVGAISQTGFRIERSSNGQGAWETILTVSGTTYTVLDTNAPPLIVFDYRIFAFNPSDESDPSNIAMAFSPPPGGAPPPGSPPKPPRLLEFLSPGVYGLERDPDGNVGGNKF